ncbi:MAG: hypothetical protein ACSHW0_13780 [Thalassotalea sp.]
MERLVNLTNKAKFIQYKESIEWIKSSPRISYIENDNRDRFGNGTYSTVTGYDCDRDGKVDEPYKCAFLFKRLKKHFEENELTAVTPHNSLGFGA